MYYLSTMPHTVKYVGPATETPGVFFGSFLSICGEGPDGKGPNLFQEPGGGKCTKNPGPGKVALFHLEGLFLLLKGQSE
jgi:hypothetical protein